MPDNEQQEVFLGRQPILDRSQQLFAYELLFRSGSGAQGNFASFLDGSQATATVIANAFTEFSMADALGPYQGFIKVDNGLLFSDLIKALTPHSVVLELLESASLTWEMLERCELLRSEGYILAVRERPESLDVLRPLHQLAQVIKVDISRVEPVRLKQLVESLKPLGKTLLAEKVEKQEQMQLCHDLGFDLFQGYYFAYPMVIHGKRLQTSKLALLRLLGLLSQDAETSEVENVLKQEPMLTVNLLRLTNPQLLRWLQLLLYSGAADAPQAVNPLLQLAATRGRLMELLVDKTPEVIEIGRDLVDQGYMVGILSLMPALVGCPMSEVICQLPVAQPVLDALKDRRGTLGDLLSLVEFLENAHDGAFDKEQSAKVENILSRLPGIDAKYANSCLSRALAWANNLARANI